MHAAVLLVPTAASAKAPAAPVDLTNQATCSVDCTVEMVGFSNVNGQTNAVLKARTT